MDPQRWQDVRRLFHAALDRPAPARRVFLSEACRHDSGLLHDVETLLAAHDGESELLAEPLVRLGRDAGPASGESPGTGPSPAPERLEESGRIGNYEILETLGAGGMGRVYLCERADGEYRGRVAVKVMHAELSGDDLVRRFRRERQILADLQHPRIARLLDGGTTAAGRPYLVMEHVEGEPIDAYCDRLKLPPRERLRLFRKVCSAVHFAHQNLVVHRDLKPANILVAADGEPRLLDFGIAKLLDGAPASTAATAATWAPMTPEFASPEQMSGESITTATDVYSLGALLYVLLSGRRPFQLSELSPEEFVLAVCHRDPKPPSAVAEPSLRRYLRGDLDKIVAKALRKRPGHRYTSAEELSQDVGRFLDALPVLAHEGSFAYLAGKFLRRHRWGAAGAATASVLATAFLVTLLIQHTRLRNEQARSREVTRFLEDLFEVSDPDRALGERVTARELLDRGVLDIRGRLHDHPELRASLLATMGRVYRKLGLYPEAAPLLEEALSLRGEIYGAHHPEVAVSLIDLGDQELSTGRYAAAEQRFHQALSTLGRRERHEEWNVRALSGLSEALRFQGDYGLAETLQNEALDRARRSLGDPHPQLARGYDRLGGLLLEKGDYAAAGTAYRRALDTYVLLYGSEHPAVADVHNNLGVLLQEQGDYAAAKEALRTAIEIQERLFSQGHRDLAPPLHNLAALLDQLGLYEEAEELCRESLAIRRSSLGERHPNIADSLNLLGLVRLHRGDYSLAEDLFRQALDMWTQLLGEDYVKVAAARNNLAQVLQAREDFDGAAAQLREALRIYRSVFGDEHMQVAVVLNNLGLLRKNRGELREARAHYEAALGILRGLLGADHPHVATLTHNLATLLEEMGDAEGAEGLYREALRALGESLDPGHATLGVVMKNLASSLVAQGRVAEAETILLEAEKLFERNVLPGGHKAVLSARRLLGTCHLLAGRYATAEPVLLSAYRLALEHYGAEARITRRARARLAELYDSWGRPGEAERYRRDHRTR